MIIRPRHRSVFFMHTGDAADIFDFRHALDYRHDTTAIQRRIEMGDMRRACLA